MKLTNWMKIWLEKYTQPRVKMRTYLMYKSLIERHISPVLGDYELKKLSPEILQDFVLQKLTFGNLYTHQNLSNNTVNSIVNVLRQVLQSAVNLGIIQKEYSRFINTPRVQEKQVVAFEKSEQIQLEKYCLNSPKPNHLGIIICLYTGLRLGELLALTWQDIDFEKRLIYINKSSFTYYENSKQKIIVDTPKTRNSNRIIPIPRQILGLLTKLKKHSKSNFVITTRLNTMVASRSYEKTFERILFRLNIPYKNFHALRHTFATRAIEIGVDVKTLSEILGHKNPMITLSRYTHSLLSHKKEMMNKLGKMLDY